MVIFAYISKYENRGYVSIYSFYYLLLNYNVSKCLIQPDDPVLTVSGDLLNADPVWPSNAAVFAGNLTLPPGLTNLNLNQTCGKMANILYF